MELNEAKEILNKAGYIVEDTALYQSKDIPFYLNKYCIMVGKIIKKGKGDTRTFAEIAKDFKAAADRQFDIIFSKVSLDEDGYPHIKVVCRRSAEDIRETYNFLLERKYKIVFDGISFCYEATTDSQGNKDYIATSDKKISAEICNYSVSKVLKEYMNFIDGE